MNITDKIIDRVLIVSLTTYFLEKGNFWFEQNLNAILTARKTQSFFENNTIYLQKNQICKLSELLRKLDEMGYEKVLEVQELGEFAQRGGLIDVFPVNSQGAFRLEFFGNTVQEISELPQKVTDGEKSRKILKKRLKSQRLFSDITGLKPGDYLVHLDHGVGRFAGVEQHQDLSYYLLEYAQGDKLYVPLGLERKLSRYVGFTDPKISRLGSWSWQKTKKKAKEDAIKFAKELLEIYAKRETAQRPPYLPDAEIDFHLASSFPHRETPDQLQAIEDVMRDLEKPKPMDRLILGDVGFGKTEIALRVMVKAAGSGRQSALICPTTILAKQHFQNFKERLKNLPLKVEVLSRFQTKKEQKATVDNLKSGKVDIVVGTHRLLSKDVEFKNLGLLVIDDEQKFGVKQKEKLKRARASLDMLSLSATPIPRTLYMALSSLKSVSLVQTPPAGRYAIKTIILPFSEKTVKAAIESELSRGGQVYYLHNKVQTIGFAQKLLRELVSMLRLGLAHGRMKEKELAKVMEDFQRKKTNVLLATTIIENGLDLPDVNTLVVADSTRLGLAQAYQIRGRVGRSRSQAYAYFLYPKKLSPRARERILALKEAEELGSGYRLAQKDLEQRGAGNILGREQSGSVNRVGLNLYCQMLSEAVDKLKIGATFT
ncbi:MAG: transcription-repair coupling factor [Parcubacteria group bacterium Gr01-1014_30]|nr:MAG: transcription-repair coupling factor [Parcubacteria group bacterium Gr01-1014_30]